MNEAGIAQNLPDQDGAGANADSAAEENLLGAIQEREAGSYGTDMDAASTQRAQSISRYLGEPDGREVEGRSQVISRDVADTVEWIKPSLMRIFTGGEQIAKFDPQNEGDVEAALQESDYVDYVIQKKNPWFQIAYEWFTDALLTRNAYAMAHWDEREEPTLERYRGLTDDQLALIAMDPSVQVIAHRAYQQPIQPPAPMAMAMMQGAMQQAFPPMNLHDVDVRRRKSYGCTKITVLPPERCLVGHESRSVSLKDCPFFEYWEQKTISSLRADGFQIDDDIADSGGTAMDQTLIDQSRDVTSGTTLLSGQDDRHDPAMRRVKVRMIWIRHDYDGDGISEYRYCVVVGNTFLVNEECEGIPVACIVPTPMPHRHLGLSIDDAVSDLQQIKTAMLRQVVDNTFLQNNGRYGVDKNKVNLDDMMVSRPGGVVRVDGPPSEGIFPFTHPNTTQAGIEVLNYLDGIRQYRTGTQQPYLGQDSISNDAMPGTVDQLQAAAAQRVELIARVLGEGVKELFQIVHQVTLQNSTAAEKVELRGKWVPVDPRTWKKRMSMSMCVGYGVSNQRRHVASLQQMIAYAKEALPYGLTDLKKIYNMLAELTKAMGFPGAERFWTEPQNGQMPPSQPPYQVQVAQIKAQADTIVQDMKNHTDMTIGQLKAEADAAKTFFTEQQENIRQQHESLVRLVSEQTDRMHELRLAHAEQKGKAEAESKKTPAPAAPNITVHPPSVNVHIDKSGKKTITTPKGAKYQVDEG